MKKFLKLKEERDDELNIIGMDDQITQPVALNIFQRIKRFFTRNA